METPDVRYNRYPGGEVASEIDGMTAHALDALRAHLRRVGTISHTDNGERRFTVGPYEGNSATWSLTAGQLQYLMTGKDHVLNYLLADKDSVKEPDVTPEQNREEMMRLFNEVLAKYPASAFTALCPRPTLPAEPTRGLFRRRRETAKEASQPSSVVDRKLEVGTISYDVTVRYEEDSRTILSSAQIWYSNGQIILWFGPHGVVRNVSVTSLIPGRGGMPSYDNLMALREATAGTATIPGTIAVTDSPLIGNRSECITIRLGYKPEFRFGYIHHANGARTAQYDAEVDQFVLKTKSKNPKYHMFSVASAVKMLDEVLSTLPVLAQIQSVPELYNPDDLR